MGWVYLQKWSALCIIMGIEGGNEDFKDRHASHNTYVKQQNNVHLEFSEKFSICFSTILLPHGQSNWAFVNDIDLLNV